MSVTEQSVAKRGRPPFGAILGYTLRACLPAKRRALLVLPCVGAVLFGALALLGDDRVEAYGGVVAIGLFGLVVPFACLIIGDAVLGAEVRDGTFAPHAGSHRSRCRSSQSAAGSAAG